MKIDIGVVISLISVGAVILTLILNTSKNNRADGIHQGKLETIMESTKHGVESIMFEMKDFKREQAKMKEQQIKQENAIIKATDIGERALKSAKEAHQRIDKLKEEK